MRKIVLFASLFTLMLVSCSKNDDNKDEEDVLEKVSVAKLEERTGTWEKNGCILTFKNGNVLRMVVMNGSGVDLISGFNYQIDGDSIFIKDENSKSKRKDGRYAAYIQFVHFKVNETQLLLRSEELPYKMKTGYYDISYLDF